MRSRNGFLQRCIPVVLAALSAPFVCAPAGCRPAAGPPPSTPPVPPWLDAETIAQIEQAVRHAIDQGRIPGAVVMVGTSKHPLYRGAFGFRARRPNREPMTDDTIFDLASLTKSVATAPAILLLHQAGKLALDDPVRKYIPGFASGDKQAVTIEHLLLHTSGLPAGGPVSFFRQGRRHAVQAICNLELQSAPGQTFRYSDLGYILLGEIVQRAAAQDLDAFVQDRILAPLGMADSGFRPTEDRLPRIAPSDQRDGHWIRGQVHDPSAFALGGVAGHAGLFATAEDLARFVRMILNAGALGGRRVFEPQTVAEMIRPRPAGVDGPLRAYGWDVVSPYASPRGYGFELGRTFGHTGFTGTSIWIDPDHDAYVILLANRLHPDGKGNVIPLRRKLGTIIGNAWSDPATRQADRRRYVTIHRCPSSPSDGGPVLSGVDVLAGSDFSVLENRRVGLIANHTSQSRDGTSTIKLLHQAPKVHLAALFSPEHGLDGKTEEFVGDAFHGGTGLKVFSLYGKTRRPTSEMMADLDALVFDIQDIGARFYTYVTTMRYAMQAAADAGIAFFVLDRPNPITGLGLFGPVADEGRQSFTCPHPLPLVHGLTAGELAWLFNRQRDIRADLHVVAMNGWRRDMWFDDTGRPWVDPSPNIRNLRQATLYPAVALLERTNVSVGRGTGTPFEWFGAPWIDPEGLAEHLRAAKLEAVTFEPVRFTPDAGLFAGRECRGVRIGLTDRDAFDPSRVGLHLVAALHELHRDTFEIDKVDVLMVSKRTLRRIKARESPEDIIASWTDQLAALRRIYKSYHLYG